MKIVQALMWMFSISIITFFGLIAFLFGAASVWFLLTLYPILTMVMLAAFAFCIVMGIAFWILDIAED